MFDGGTPRRVILPSSISVDDMGDATSQRTNPWANAIGDCDISHRNVASQRCKRGDNARPDGFYMCGTINFDIRNMSGFFVLVHFGMKTEIQRKMPRSDAM